MRAILGAFGTRGDVQPMVALALEMRRRGHTITICGPPNFASWVSSRGVDFVPVGMDYERAVARMELDLSEGLRLLHGEVVAQFRDVDAVCEGADVLVASSAFVAGPSIAQRRSIPFAYAVFSPSMLASSAHPSPVVPFQRWPRWANRASWGPYEALMSAVFLPQVNRARRAWGLPAVRRVWSHLFEDLVLVASEPELAPLPSDAPPRAVQTGAWFFDDAEGGLDEALERFLGEGPAPVYVGFGSMADKKPERTSAAVVAAVRGAGLRAVVSRGWANLGHADATNEVHFVGPTSHARLFERVRAVVHHGGAGTTAAAARAGVPQLVVPHILDQFYWGGRVASAGLGPEPVSKRALTAPRLEAALREATQRTSMIERARAVGARVELGGVARAADALDSLVAARR